MSEHPSDCPQAPRAPKRTSRATKLLQAAALAAVLVPLGSVALEADMITCDPSGGCGSGLYQSSSGGNHSNTWLFYDTGGSLLYSLMITGTPANNLSLSVQDVEYWEGGPPVQTGQPYSAWECVPIHPSNHSSPWLAGGHCATFDVTVEDSGGNPSSWVGAYDLYIKWYPNLNDLSHPGVVEDVTILMRDDPSLPFGSPLSDITYDPGQGPGTDPGIGGRGNGFSEFGVFTNPTPTPTPVPEPASLILVGTGLAGALYRAWRRKRQP